MTVSVSASRRLPTEPPGLPTQNSALKRLVDYVLGVPLFILALPIMGAVALAVKVISPGPALFKQDREGRNGRTIQLLKFRTMYVDADERLRVHLEQNPASAAEWRQFFKLTDDPRVLPWIGPFLRKSSLDELPNLWNVLRGDLSLVGPRPFPLYHVVNFDPEFRKLRQSAWPGLTGLWQLERGDLSAQEAWDTQYVRNWSIWMDLRILLRTPLIVLRGKAYY